MTGPRSALGAGALALLLAATPAAAQGPAPAPNLFDAFKTVCGEARASFAKTDEAAAAMGLSRFNLPIPIPFKDGKITRKSIRFKALAGGGHVMYFAGVGELGAGKAAPFETCAVAVQPAELGPTVRRLESWLGQPAERGEKGKLSIRFHEANGTRRAAPQGKLKELAKTLGSGTLTSVDALPHQKGAVVTYTVVKL